MEGNPVSLLGGQVAASMDLKNSNDDGIVVPIEVIEGTTQGP